MSLIAYAPSEPSSSTKSAWRVAKSPDVSRQNRNRKGAKARTWTDAEESYLIESRTQRIQYKQIAARLQKSELACRLHYHQLTKHRPSIEVEMCDPDDYRGLQSTPRVSPCPSNITPPTQHGGMEHLKLPSLNALFDDNTHRRSISLPVSLNVPMNHSQRQLSPPAYILPPPRRLMSPFDETRALQPTPDGQRGHLSSPGESYSQNRGGHHGHQRAHSFQGYYEFNAPRTASSPNMSYFDTPRQVLPSFTTSAAGDRCSVNALLNHHGGSLTI